MVAAFQISIIRWPARVFRRLGFLGAEGFSMIYRKLGASGWTPRSLDLARGPSGDGCGAGPTNGRPSPPIHAAIDHGVTLIDTAPVYGYGRSEEIVGRAIRDRRHNVLVATKCGLIWDREEGVLLRRRRQGLATPGPRKFKSTAISARPRSATRSSRASAGCKPTTSTSSRPTGKTPPPPSTRPPPSCEAPSRRGRSARSASPTPASTR